MFEGSFEEGENQSATMEEIDGVVMPRSFQMLVQWVCLGRVIFGECAPDVSITMAIEFARLADMCRVTGMESLMAEHIKATILANPAPADNKWSEGRPPDTNTHWLTSNHITSGIALPEGHPVRIILVAATVEEYLRRHSYKFEEETSSVPEFSADLHKAVRATLESVSVSYHRIAFADPISGMIWFLEREREE
jgi:hypothetical protein